MEEDWFCTWCGLPQKLDPGLSGCSGETVLEHTYVDPASRPFSKWGKDRIQKRMMRALTKAASSKAVVLHARVCPGRSYGLDYLYEEKFVKRRNLAAHLLRELLFRSTEEIVPLDQLNAVLDEQISGTVDELAKA